MAWYLAEIVLEVSIEDDPRNVVHVNTPPGRRGFARDGLCQGDHSCMASEQEYLNTATGLSVYSFAAFAS